MGKPLNTEDLWFEWGGNVYPPKKVDNIKQVKFRDGTVHPVISSARGLRWTHERTLGDIIAYCYYD